MYTNCDCLTREKLSELKCYIHLHPTDIIALTEVLPKATNFQCTPDIYHMDGYTMFNSDFNDGRGALIYIREVLGATDFEVIDSCQDCVWCKLSLAKGDKLILGCIYRSPHSTVENITKLYDMLTNVCAINPSHMLILGDFNFKEINWNLFNCNVNETHHAYKFLECVRDCYLFQHVKQPTRFRNGQEPSILDLVLTNEELMVNNMTYSPGLGKSDHLILTFQFVCYTESIETAFSKRNYHKGDYKKICSELEVVDWNQVLQRLSLSESWEILVDKLTNLIESNVPVCKANRDTAKKCPYINNECLMAIKKKHSKWTKFQHCKTDQNYNQYKIARNKTIAELRKAKYLHEKDLAANIKTNSKLFWSYVRSKLKTKSAIGQLQGQDGTAIDDNQEKADLLNSYFASVFQNEESEPIPNFEDRAFQHEINTVMITLDKISKTIDRLKPSKSQGPDNIHPMLLKECKRVLVTPLKYIFEKSIEEGKIPVIWKSAHVSAIFKSGSKSKPENYRPISLTSVPGKLLERIIRDEIVNHMTENNLFAKSQHGFLAGKSCVTQLLEFLEDVTTALDRGEDVDVIYLDLSKAFDRVPHKRLLKKLWGYGIRGNIHAWVKDFLSNRTQKVKINGTYSESIQVTSGVPQGSVLGPILFLIYINDLPEAITVLMKLFADDAKIYRSITNVRHVNQVQTSVNNAVTWTNIWEMMFNFKKCKHLHIGSRTIPANYTMNSGQDTVEIEKVPYEKDLGVIIDQALNFSKHISTKVSKANQNLGIIFRTFTYMDKDMFLNLYKSIVRPHLEYAVTVCAPLYKKDMIAIENVQRRATKLVTNIKHLSYKERLKKLGLPSLEYRRERADLIEVYKIMNDIDQVDKDKLFEFPTYTATRGHQFKLAKKQHRLKVRSNSFSLRVIDSWNSLPETVVMAPSLNCFKSRLNTFWKNHPYKFDPWCYIPGPKPRDYYYKNAPTEAD